MAHVMIGKSLETLYDTRMMYRRIAGARPSVLFQLQLNAGLARLFADVPGRLPPPRLGLRLRDYVESLLLAHKLPPKAAHLAMLVEKFAQLIALSETGKPFVYRKSRTISLLFDVCALQSEMRLDAPDELVLAYTRMMMGFLLFHPQPRQIAMVGLGGGSLPKYCYRTLPQARIAVAENNPDVIALREHFLIPRDGHRFAVTCEDGADFVRRASAQFDVLLIDGFDRTGQPEQLCSQRFYDDCHAALARDGILVVNLLGDVAETQTWLDRIAISFDDRMVAIEAPDGFNRIVFACKGSLLDAPQRLLLARLRMLEAQHPVMLRLTLERFLQQRHQAQHA